MKLLDAIDCGTRMSDAPPSSCTIVLSGETEEVLGVVALLCNGTVGALSFLCSGPVGITIPVVDIFIFM